MRVFISWSGGKSEAVARVLNDWIPQVIQSVTPFVSSEAIRAGGRWQNEIASALEETSFGVVCVTADNQAEPWLNFEAGAVGKVVKTSRVIPLAIDLTVSDVKQPLAQFQAQEADEAGIRKLVESINDHSEEPLGEAILGKAFDQWWPQLRDELESIQSTSEAEPPDSRSERELLEEVLDTVRGMARSQGSNLAPSRLAEALSEVGDALPTSARLSLVQGTNRIEVHSETPIVGEQQTPLRRIAGERGYALDFSHASES